LDLQKQPTASKPKIFEVIRNEDFKKVVKLHLTASNCSLKKGKKIYARVSVDDLYTNGIFD